VNLTPELENLGLLTLVLRNLNSDSRPTVRLQFCFSLIVYLRMT